MSQSEMDFVRIDPTAPTAIAFRYVKPEDKYPHLTNELATKLGITTPKVVGFVKLFQMRGNDEFHTSIKVSKTGSVSRYSDKAQDVLANAIAKEGIDKLWSEAKAGRRRDVRDYIVNGKKTTSEQPALSAEAKPNDG